jgi:arginyl-tRNA synthetase
MNNIASYLITSLELAYTKTNYPQTIPTKLWKVSNKSDHGDYVFAGSIAISKIIKENSFESVQQTLVDNLSILLHDEFIIGISGRNINFQMTNKFINDQLLNIVKINNIIKPTLNPEKILVDFSSPNVAKDLHVGHLRSTIIGDTICRVFEKLGHDVSRINHIGDFGTHFGMLVQHLFESKPDFENNPPDIKNLQEFYVGAKKRFSEDAEFKKLSHEKTVLLQQNDPDVVKAWKLICDISKVSYDDIYKQLNINIDECGESFYRMMLPDVVKELEEAGMLTDSDGAKVLFIPGTKFPLIVVKSDGGYTYDTTDLAAIKYRLQTLKMDRIYYVVGSAQASHFSLVFKAAQAIGWYNPNIHTVEHVGFGLMLGEDGTPFKSRDGNTIPLTELLSEALNTAEKSILDSIEEDKICKCKPTSELLCKSCSGKSKDTYMTQELIQIAIPAVAYGAIKYIDLSSVRTTDYKFSFEKMLGLKGNTVVYQLYSHIRLSGILRKLKDVGDLYNIDAFTEFTFNDKLERNVSTKILQLAEVIGDVENSVHPHKLCTYLYELSDSLQKFCTKCRCINFDKDDKPVNVDMSRAMLCKLTHKIQQEIFFLLNIQTIERI